jgi:hypothetical protein
MTAFGLKQLEIVVFRRFLGLARWLPNRKARLTEGISTMKILLQSETFLNLFSHQAVGWAVMKVNSLCGYIKVFF